MQKNIKFILFYVAGIIIPSAVMTVLALISEYAFYLGMAIGVNLFGWSIVAILMNGKFRQHSSSGTGGYPLLKLTQYATLVAVLGFLVFFVFLWLTMISL
ncbi:MAG: hypothetical protein Q8P90_02245 [bacterium]|nr:hypothetical protein [bacterium]